MIEQRQRNPIIQEVIMTQNKILELQQKKQRIIKQSNDLKDLLRKYRQKQIPIKPSYTLSNGAYVKRPTKQLYPALQKAFSQLTQQKNFIHKSLIQQMKCIVKMIKAQLIGKSQLDARVFNLLVQYQTSYEDQLMSSSDQQDIN